MPDGMVEYVERSEAVFQKFYQDEIPIGRIDFHVVEFLKPGQTSVTFRKDKFSRTVDIICILEHQLPGVCPETV